MGPAVFERSDIMLSFGAGKDRRVSQRDMRAPAGALWHEISASISSATDAATVREQVRALAQRAGFGGTEQSIICTLISEITHYIVDRHLSAHATINTANRYGKAGVVIVVRIPVPENLLACRAWFQKGQRNCIISTMPIELGLADLQRMEQHGSETYRNECCNTLPLDGADLSGLRHFLDKFDILSSPDETTITMTKWWPSANTTGAASISRPA
jgi:hypothetical protein